MTAFMDGYKAAWEDILQALEDVPCRCCPYHDCRDTHKDDRCHIYRGDLDAIVQGALRGCEPP